MDVTYTIDDTLVDSVSKQFENRTPLATDARGVPTETTAEHVDRAVTELLDAEMQAARNVAADDAVDAATSDTELKTALLAKHKLMRPAVQ